MSEVSVQANAIVLAASTRMVALCAQAGQNLFNGIESKTQFTQAHKILTCLKAYQHSNDMNAYESDALLYCLKKLSDASSFPTTSPIVGQSLTITLLKSAGALTIYNQGSLLSNDFTEIDFEEITATKTGNRITIEPPDGVVILVGDYDGSSGDFPTGGGTGVAGLIKKGNEFDIPADCAIQGVNVSAGSTIRAKVTNPSNAWTDWRMYS